MLTNPSIVRRAYDSVALFALLNMVGLSGLIAYLIGGGALDRQKALAIVRVMRAEEAPTAAEDDDLERAESTTEVTIEDTAGVEIKSQRGLEAFRREADRIKAELDQRLALSNSIMLRVTTEREAFRKEREAAAEQQERLRAQSLDEGFRKQVAIYESLAPKVAVQHLLAMDDPESAARLLLEMDTRKAKKIVESAKRGDQMSKMKVILQRLREVAPARSEELGSGGG